MVKTKQALPSSDVDPSGKELHFRLEHAAGQTVSYRDSWRIFRIVSEIVEGYQFLQGLYKEVTIMGSARLPSHSKYYRVARELGSLLAKKGFSVITGGGPGIMEAGNRGAHEVKGKSIGLNIQLPFEQRINPYVNDSIAFYYFFTRKVMLTAPANAFFFFPGGFGTFDEFFEVVDYMESGLMDRTPIILVGHDFWDPLVEFLREQVAQGLKAVSLEEIDRWHIVETAEEAFKVVKDLEDRSHACTIDSSSPFCQIGTEWNIFRIMAELVNGFEFLTTLHKEVTVFGTQSSETAALSYCEDASEIGRLLGERHGTVITGGGPGLQEHVSRGAFEAGGVTVGFPLRTKTAPAPNPYLKQSLPFFFPFIRKLILTAPAHGFVFLPGGFGTMHHLFELLTLQQTNKMDKTPTILYGSAFWQPMLEMIKKLATDFKTISLADQKLIRLVDRPADVLRELEIAEPEPKR